MTDVPVPPRIRAAARPDLGAIAKIYAHYVRHSTATFELEPPDEAEWRRRFGAITDAGLPFLVAELDGAVAGYAYCGPWKARPAYRQTVEESIYLATWATGRGAGGALLDAALRACADAGLREVLAVVVSPGDPASLALHRSRGFAEVGRLTGVGFKHGQWLDTLLLQLSLRPGA